MSDLTLYTVADQYLADIKKLQDMEIDDQTFADTLEGLAGDLEVKATNVALFIRNLEANADAIKAWQTAERAWKPKLRGLNNTFWKICFVPAFPKLNHLISV